MMNKQEKLAEAEIQEILPEDGQTEIMPILPLQAETSQKPDYEDYLPDFSMNEMTTNNYTADEFKVKFQSILEFLENPAAANDVVAELVSNGRNLTADKIYNLASRYSWLNWVIDRRCQMLADSLQIAVFLAIESNVVIMSWTGLNIFEKVKLWLKDKANKRKQQLKSEQRRSLFGWVFSGRPEAEKATEPQS